MSEVNDHIARLKRANEKKREMRESGIPIERLDPIEAARRDPSSLRRAINGKCWDCIGAGNDPNPRRAIRDCGIVACTLHPVRPYQRK